MPPYDFVDFIEFGFVTFAGLCLGSFATALIYRWPRSIPWVWDQTAKENKACRSACPKCGSLLRAFDLIPVFSWVFFRGRCRFCKAAISPLYPLIELTAMGFSLSLYFSLGFNFGLMVALMALPFLLAISVLEWQGIWVFSRNKTFPVVTLLILALFIYVFLTGLGFDSKGGFF